METYMTIEETAAYLKLAAQTIRRYVLNREIPFHKIKKVVRFRLSELDRWVDDGGVCRDYPVTETVGDLFANAGAGEDVKDGGDNTGAGEAAAIEPGGISA